MVPPSAAAIRDSAGEGWAAGKGADRSTVQPTTAAISGVVFMFVVREVDERGGAQSRSGRPPFLPAPWSSRGPAAGTPREMAHARGNGRGDGSWREACPLLGGRHQRPAVRRDAAKREIPAAAGRADRIGQPDADDVLALPQWDLDRAALHVRVI